MRWSNPRQPPDERWREAIVTRSPLMLRLLEQARLVAQSDVSVLINGQSGTGERDFRPGYPQRQPAQQQTIYCY
ncbi:two component system DNA-binding response regulator [Escherichia coli]|uniref:Two component system DNA-binding response regulator n=1 Tax=Escherichia coli TaxID=562 RepID=A0A2X3K3Q4_ECOLX|nr:two component system DNA-binding response regulator [Escherichia coli]